MESGRLFFDTSACRGNNMLFLGNGDLAFRGDFLIPFLDLDQLLLLLLLFLALITFSVWLLRK